MGLGGSIGNIAKKLATTAGDVLKKTSPAYQVYKRRKKIVKGAKSAAKKVVTGKAGRYVSKKLYGVEIKKVGYKEKMRKISKRRLDAKAKLGKMKAMKKRVGPTARKVRAKIKHIKEQDAYRK